MLSNFGSLNEIHTAQDYLCKKYTDTGYSNQKAMRSLYTGLLIASEYNLACSSFATKYL